MGKQYLNGVLYGTGEIIKFSPYIYSLEEREVGVWTDGKPLYQKTITGTTDSSSNTTQAYDLATNNIQTVVSCVGYVGWTNSYGDNAIRNLSGYADSNAFGDWGVSADGTKLLIFHGNYMRGKSYVITLQYTKTTDIPGSGNWTDEGVPTHHYSTDEKVIGTWIDGKPLYEKTINTGALPNNATNNVNHGISNLKRVIGVSGYACRSSGDIVNIPLPYVGNNSNLNTVVYVGLSHIGIVTFSDRSAFTESYVTLQYTKTS